MRIAKRSITFVLFALTLGFACGTGATGDDLVDASGDLKPVDAGTDAATADGALNCIEQGFTAGQRYSVGDQCNFCNCNENGTTDCTNRSCLGASLGGCEYNGVMHDYGERFAASDACNECVCAASGLACTRRTETCADTVDEGAILLETLDEECGVAGFNTQAVLDQLPHSELALPFLYDRDGPRHPETLPDTKVTFRIVRDVADFAVCRIPAVGQEAIDLEVLIELVTDDGAFDETFHAYLRRNAGGFLDVWTLVAAVEVGGLNGSHAPNCPEFGGYSFDATINADRSASGSVWKVCETDIALRVGVFDLVAPE